MCLARRVHKVVENVREQSTKSINLFQRLTQIYIQSVLQNSGLGSAKPAQGRGAKA